jgi:hypothetical protein
VICVLLGENSVSELWRKEDINQNLYYPFPDSRMPRARGGRFGTILSQQAAPRPSMHGNGHGSDRLSVLIGRVQDESTDH